MARSVKELIGKTDDAMPPPKVRQRIYDRNGGMCHECQQDIAGKKWNADHVKALILGGENRETNLAPICIPCHVLKTAKEVKEKSKTQRQRAKHTGAKRPNSKLARKEPKEKKGDPFGSLPKRRLYQ